MKFSVGDTVIVRNDPFRTLKYPVRCFVIAYHGNRSLMSDLNDEGHIICNDKYITHTRFVLTEKMHKFTNSLDGLGYEELNNLRYELNLV